MYAPLSTGGNDIVKYELYIDNGFVNSQFVKV